MPLAVSFPRPSWVRFNHLSTNVGLFQSETYKCVMACTAACKCGAKEQTAEHVITFRAFIYHCHRGLKGIHSRPDTNRTGAEGLSFYYPRLLHCLDQMLAVMSLSQHRVLSSKTVRPCAPCGALCIGHAVSTWSAVCSEAPHSQFGEGARPICAPMNGIAQRQSEGN